VDRRKQVYKNMTQSRRIVVPSAHRQIKTNSREVLLETKKPQVVAKATVKELKPKINVDNVQKTNPKNRVTIDSFKTTDSSKKTTRPTSVKKTATNSIHQKAPKLQPQPVNNQNQKVQHSKQQHSPEYPVQTVQYHNHYYNGHGQNMPVPQPIHQQPAQPMMQPHPSQYHQAVMAAQQQPQVPIRMANQYPLASSNGAATMPVKPQPKRQAITKPRAQNSNKSGLAKFKDKINKPDMKYKPTDIMRYAIVTFFVIMASYLAFDTWNTNQQLQNAVGGESASASDGQHSSSADVENPPMENGVAYPDYQVADDMPRIISVPSLNLTARVSEVGLTTANKIDVPADASMAGWYNGSAKLDNIGAAFITGHYNGEDSGGVFDNLNKLGNGEKITIEMGDGSKLSYEVVKVENVPVSQVNMSQALSTSEGVTEGLNIMTCQGSWSSSGFSNRLTVFSKRV